MPNSHDPWAQLAADARRNADPPSEAPPALVARIVARWRGSSPQEPSSMDLLQFLGLRAAVAASLLMLAAVLFSADSMVEIVDPGISFLPDAVQVEVVP